MQPTKSTALPVLQTPFCGDLRSKKTFMRNEIFLTADEFYDQSGHIWCYHTQMPVGPDGFRAEPEYCTPDRVCYRSALAPPAGPPEITKPAPIPDIA